MVDLSLIGELQDRPEERGQTGLSATVLVPTVSSELLPGDVAIVLKDRCLNIYG